jgi:hypothetical protein
MMTAPINPALPGPFAFDPVIYASAGLNYAVPAWNQFTIYDAPAQDYVTPRVNLSAFAELGSAPWPFLNTAVPLNGHIRIPRSRGPFGSVWRSGSRAAPRHFVASRMFTI